MADLKAVLGPTNTGKTHYAIERMLAHTSGMIGLPLRLLAREVYDRVVAAKGPAACALVTGEERIWPETARYFVCTVESMPLHQEVAFMAVDEIQLAADPDRGHLFTHRILNARGTGETLLLGADTMREALAKLGLKVDTERRERFSQLTHMGPLKITKLPKRSAIVAFSAEEVYAIAELLRRQKGGAAVVMGALSPRTRNAQVELYQSGEVDYLVATDAIGMGLNLDADHIAFASRAKFDGRRRRRLTPAEMGQIAGRAGRFRSDGTFGETADCPLFEEELVAAVESHRFDAVTQLSWRNADLDYASVQALLQTLARPSGDSVLRQNPDALDEWVLRRLHEEGLTGEAKGARRVRRLWDLCTLPDFRKAGPEGHLRLVESLLGPLADPDARLTDEWVAERVQRLDNPDGDIAALQDRVAAIRTWTYAAYRPDWLAQPEHWRDETRAIEDRLSDALHERLTQRFVDRRTSALMAGLKREDALLTEITPEGEIKVEGHVVGRLNGLVFEPAVSGSTLEGKAVRNAALAALRPILSARLHDIATAMSPAFRLDPEGRVLFDDQPIARLSKGRDWLTPAVELIGAQEATPDQRQRAAARLIDWVSEELAHRLPVHAGLRIRHADEAMPGPARGIAFRVMEAGAAIDLREDDPSHRLTPADREALKGIGVRAGRLCAHVPDAEKPAAQSFAALLRSVHEQAHVPHAPAGAGSFALTPEWTDTALATAGYLRFGPRAIRADLAERLAWEVDKRRREAGKNLFVLPAELASIISCPGGDFPAVLKGFGVQPAEKDAETGAVTQWRFARRASPEGMPPRRERPRRGPKPGGEAAAATAGGEAGAAPQAAEGASARPDRKPRRERRPDTRQGHENRQGNRPPREDRGPRRDDRGPRRGPSPARINPDSPFAVLAALIEPVREEAPRKRPKKKKKRGPAPGATPAPDASGAETGNQPETSPQPAAQPPETLPPQDGPE